MMLIYQATLPICEPKKAKFDEKIVRWTLNPTFLLFYMKKKTLAIKNMQLHKDENEIYCSCIRVSILSHSQFLKLRITENTPKEVKNVMQKFKHVALWHGN